MDAGWWHNVHQLQRPRGEDNPAVREKNLPAIADGLGTPSTIFTKTERHTKALP